MEILWDWSEKRLINTPVSFNRYLYNRLDWEQRLIGITGARGVGKTTLMLQRIKELNTSDALYVSLDNLYFSSNKLFDVAAKFRLKGGKYLFLDEVHKYPDWSQELKNIYDMFPELKVVFTSSSALEIYKGKYDLSRRALLFDLRGLSLREYLELQYKIKLPAMSLDVLLSTDQSMINNYLSVIPPLKYLSEYLRSGYYPFFIEDVANYHKRLRQTINLVIEVDLPATNNIDYQSTIKLKRLLYIISQVAPYTPNINKLAQQIGATRDTTLKLLYLLHNAHILRWLSADASGINYLNKPDKIYLENTNIGAAIATEIQLMNVGTMRETFVASQLAVDHQLTYPKSGDLLVDGKYLFEIGGKNKSSRQIHGTSDAWVVKDDIEYRHANILPLWLFGFLY